MTFSGTSFPTNYLIVIWLFTIIKRDRATLIVQTFEYTYTGIVYGSNATERIATCYNDQTAQINIQLQKKIIAFLI